MESLDIIDFLLESHSALRGSAARVAALLETPRGTGWDDRVNFDKTRILRELADFFSEFKAHVAVEEAYLTRILRQLDTELDPNGVIAEGHRAVGNIIQLFGTVAVCSDGDHVYRLRTVFDRLREELETYLSFEDMVVFPKLRNRLPALTLKELGRRAAQRRAVLRCGRVSEVPTA